MVVASLCCTHVPCRQLSSLRQDYAIGSGGRIVVNGVVMLRGSAHVAMSSSVVVVLSHCDDAQWRLHCRVVSPYHHVVVGCHHRVVLMPSTAVVALC